MIAAGEKSDGEDSETTIDAEDDEQEDVRARMLRKAGLPQFEPDTLASSIAQKMMNLF